MRIALLAFTREGTRQMHRLLLLLVAEGHCAQAFYLSKFAEAYEGVAHMQALPDPPSQWVKQQFFLWDGLIFVSALGIAARLTAPCLLHKAKDPAVVVMDEAFTFSIPLLSGHIGGANELALWLSGKTGAIPVITTATDVRGLFAVDVFAATNHLAISDMELAKQISAALLDGESVGLFSDYPIQGELPPGLLWAEEKRLNIRISIRRKQGPFLTLIPSVVTVGIGCRRGCQVEQLDQGLQSMLEQEALYPESLLRIATIDLKKDEPGLLQLCDRLGLSLVTYTADRLLALPGDYTESEFVRQTTGVGNVCERAAVCEGGQLIREKTRYEGMTLALAAGDQLLFI